MGTRQIAIPIPASTGPLGGGGGPTLAALHLQSDETPGSPHPSQPATTASPSPSSGLAPGALAEYDQQLVTSLRSHGLSIANPSMTARDAHLICARLQHGQSVAEVKRDYTQVSQGDSAVADLFVSTVMQIYPSCP